MLILGLLNLNPIILVFNPYLIRNTLDNLITSYIEKESVHLTKPLFSIAPSPIIQLAIAIAVNKSYILYGMTLICFM